MYFCCGLQVWDGVAVSVGYVEFALTLLCFLLCFIRCFMPCLSFFLTELLSIVVTTTFLAPYCATDCVCSYYYFYAVLLTSRQTAASCPRYCVPCRPTIADYYRQRTAPQYSSGTMWCVAYNLLLYGRQAHMCAHCRYCSTSPGPTPAGNAVHTQPHRGAAHCCKCRPIQHI